LDGAGSAGSALTPEEPCQGWDGPTAVELTARLLIDLLIAADFLMHFLLGFSYYDLKRRKPIYIWAPHTIFKHYVASPRFLYDLAGAMPIDTILRMQGTQTGYIYADIASILRLLRLQSVVEITKPLNLVIKRAAVLFPPIEPISKLLMMIMSIVGITHFMACLLYFTGHPYFDDDDICNMDTGRDTCGWVKLQGWSSESGETDIAAKYVTALYYASTQITTVGFGDISARTTLERLFSVFSQMFGGFVFGYVLGNISTLLAAENLALSTHSSYMETLHHFMNHEGVPATLHRRVMTYMEHRYPQRNIYDENRLYSELTPSLRGEIAYHRFGNVIQNLPMFEGLKYQAAALLCSRIALCSFVQGDTITNEGNVADRLFIVKQGLVNIYDNDPALKLKAAAKAVVAKPVVATTTNGHEIDVGDATLVNVVGIGHAVAELAAVMPYVQLYTCKCMEYCLVCTLQRKHILEIAGVYDDVADALAKLVRSNKAKVQQLCMKNSSYEQILAQMEELKDCVHTDVDAILGGGLSGGVNFGASAMDEVSNADALAEILKLSDMHGKLADQMQQGFEALHARLDTMQARQK
jgi:CRP-like cAMP-binding protein